MILAGALFLSILILVTSADALRVEPAHYDPVAAVDRVRYSPEVPRPAGEPPFTLEALARLARDKGTIEATIEALPAHLRSRYTLMYRSRSLQSASFLAPRAILFEDDGSFAVSFNGGDARVRGHDKLEAMQFRAETARWEFREIDFSSGAPILSEANPRKCLECHQSARRADVDPRPNWEPYFFWPGAYGGVDGQPGRTMAGNPYGDPEGQAMLALLAAEQMQEPAQLEAFHRDVKPSHPRYRTLGEFVARRTLDLTDALTDLNSFRVGRLVTQTPDWVDYRDSITAVFFCTGSVDDGATLAPELAAAHTESYGSVRPPFFAVSGGFYGRNTDRRMRYMFDARGVDTSDWSMDFKTGGRFAFSDRFGSPSFPERQLLTGLRRAIGLSPDQARECDEAKARALARAAQNRDSGRLAELASIARAKSAAGSRPESSPQTQLQRCAVCHVGAARTGPSIPFDDIRRLAPALRRTGYLRGTLLQEIEHRVGDFAIAEEQMPPGGAPTVVERERLLEFLKGL